jgi:hypothetical protein
MCTYHKLAAAALCLIFKVWASWSWTLCTPEMGSTDPLSPPLSSNTDQGLNPSMNLSVSYLLPDVQTISDTSKNQLGVFIKCESSDKTLTWFFDVSEVDCISGSRIRGWKVHSRSKCLVGVWWTRRWRGCWNPLLVAYFDFFLLSWTVFWELKLYSLLMFPTSFRFNPTNRFGL